MATMLCMILAAHVDTRLRAGRQLDQAGPHCADGPVAAILTPSIKAVDARKPWTGGGPASQTGIMLKTRETDVQFVYLPLPACQNVFILSFKIATFPAPGSDHNTRDLISATTKRLLCCIALPFGQWLPEVAGASSGAKGEGTAARVH